MAQHLRHASGDSAMSDGADLYETLWESMDCTAVTYINPMKKQ